MEKQLWLRLKLVGRDQSGNCNSLRSAVARDVAITLALVALHSATTPASASTLPRFGAVARDVTWFAAVVAISATATSTATTSLGALAGHVTSLVTIVASHARATTIPSLTRLSAVTGDMASFSAVVTSTITHLIADKLFYLRNMF